MARQLSVDELFDRALAQLAKDYPNSDPAEIAMTILRYRRRAPGIGRYRRRAPGIGTAVEFVKAEVGDRGSSSSP